MVGNQIGAVNIKKVRTWRQYMNRFAPSIIKTYLRIDTCAIRRGGFNRYVMVYVYTHKSLT